MIQITDNQRALILLAVQTGGRIEQYPDNLKGGARTAVTRSLVLNDLIVADGAGYALTAAAYAAVDLPPPGGDAGEGSEPNDSDVTNPAQNAEGQAQHESEGADSGGGDGDGDGPETNADSGASGGDDAADGEEPEAATPAKPRKATRIDQVVTLMQRPQGVTIKEVMEATGWQQHSVRGFFAGTLKKKGYTVTNSKSGGGERVYRIETEEEANAEGSAADTHRDEQE